MLETLREIAGKIWHVGRLLIPGVAIFELLRSLFATLVDKFTAWATAKLDFVWGLVKTQMESLSVDLTPSPVFLGYVTKLNAVVPLEEMWFYFLLYLGVASVVLGVKWMRNLIPGLK